MKILFTKNSHTYVIDSVKFNVSKVEDVAVAVW